MSKPKWKIESWVFKALITLSVIWSFVWANLGYAGALRLWTEGWEALLVFLGMGLGLSWSKDVMHHKIDADAGKKEAEPPAE